LTRGNLLDLNVLLALVDKEHEFYPAAHLWFDSWGHADWGLCPFTEAGFIRLTTNPALGPIFPSIRRAIQVLEDLASRPGYRYWPMTESWSILTAPFAARIAGHQQVTDAYLLGMAIKEDGVLVTLDRGLKYLAGPQFSRNLLILA
jgi:uncharacterized protein